MPKQTTTSSLKNADLRKRQAAKFAELEARDEFERQWAMQDLTNPEKVGLSTQHASLISDKLREAYIKKEILAQEDDDDAVDFKDDEDKDEDSVEDDIEFSEPEDEQDEPKMPSKKKPPFMREGPESDIDGIEETPAEGLGMGRIEDELEDEDLGFPSDEDEDITDDTLEHEFPEKKEFPGKGMGREPGMGISEKPEMGLPGMGREPEMGLSEGPEMGMGEEMSGFPGEEEVSLEPGQDEVILELPGGQKLSLKLLEKPLANPMKEENIMASTKNLQERKAARREQIASIIREAAEQSEPEQIKPSTEKKLGDDTSSQGKDFVMEDATRGVANPGLKGKKMTLENSGGNSLLSNPNFSENKIPTVNPELLANNPDAYNINKFSTEQSGLFTKKMEDTEDKLPTMGDKDALWGDKGFIDGFELPSQLPSTQERRTNVLKTAEKFVECAGCYNEDDSPLSVVACDDCGNKYPLCQHCIEDNECPVCASIQEENVREATGPNWEAYCKTPKDRAEVCEDDRGDGDLNNDGGFRVKRTKDDDEGDGNYDLEVNASTKVKKLEKENQELQLTLAKFAKAVETATVMAYGQAIDVTDIPGQVSKFMQDKATNAAGLEHVRQTVAALAKKNSQTKLSDVEKGMKKGASVPKISPVGFGFNPNPSQSSASNDLIQSLQGIFTVPKKVDDDE